MQCHNDIAMKPISIKEERHEAPLTPDDEHHQQHEQPHLHSQSHHIQPISPPLPQPLTLPHQLHQPKILLSPRVDLHRIPKAPPALRSPSPGAPCDAAALDAHPPPQVIFTTHRPHGNDRPDAGVGDPDHEYMQQQRVQVIKDGRRFYAASVPNTTGHAGADDEEATDEATDDDAADDADDDVRRPSAHRPHHLAHFAHQLHGNSSSSSSPPPLAPVHQAHHHLHNHHQQHHQHHQQHHLQHSQHHHHTADAVDLKKVPHSGGRSVNAVGLGGGNEPAATAAAVGAQFRPPVVSSSSSSSSSNVGTAASVSASAATATASSNNSSQPQPMRPPPPPPPPRVKGSTAEEPSSSIPDLGE